MTDQKPRTALILLIFLATVGLACFVNVVSYFVRSSGYGVLEINDGVIGVGWPFLMFEEGGIDGRHRFYLKAAAANFAVAAGVGALVAGVWYFIARRRSGLKEP
jgi:hypothetical protein